MTDALITDPNRWQAALARAVQLARAGSCATSGGEGTARGRYILEAEAQYERQKQQLAARVQPPVSGSGQ